MVIALDCHHRAHFVTFHLVSPPLRDDLAARHDGVLIGERPGIESGRQWCAAHCFGAGNRLSAGRARLRRRRFGALFFAGAPTKTGALWRPSVVCTYPAIPSAGVPRSVVVGERLFSLLTDSRKEHDHQQHGGDGQKRSREWAGKEDGSVAA